jgi:site-specific DNA-cytosine methylase
MAPAFSKRPGQQIATRDDGLSYAVTTGEPPRVLAYRKSARARTSPESGGAETWVDDGLANTINCFDQGGERDTHAIVTAHSVTFNDVNGTRPDRPNGGLYCTDITNGVTRALTCAEKDSTLVTEYEVRRLLPEECEMLQAFPVGHTAIPWGNKSPVDCPDGPRYKALGNSMCVNVIAWIGAGIERALTIWLERAA